VFGRPLVLRTPLLSLRSIVVVRVALGPGGPRHPLSVRPLRPSASLRSARVLPLRGFGPRSAALGLPKRQARCSRWWVAALPVAATAAQAIVAKFRTPSWRAWASGTRAGTPETKRKKSGTINRTTRPVAVRRQPRKPIFSQREQNMKIRSIVGQLSGSLGGQTASRNRGGQYLRMRSVPTNPNTMYQQTVRNVMATLVQLWNDTLTPAQRSAWNAYAAAVPVTDSLGESINLTGQNWYIGNNTARVNAGLARVDDAPTIFNQGNPVTGLETTNNSIPNVIGLDGSTTDIVVLVEGGASDDGDVIVQFGEPVNPSRTFFKGPYRGLWLSDAPFTTAIAAAAANTLIGASIASITSITPPVDGQYRAIRLRIAYDDGRLSAPYELLTNVVDDPI
jgi:hypothetical protein